MKISFIFLLLFLPLLAWAPGSSPKGSFNYWSAARQAKVVKIARAIRFVESSNNYHAVGKNGEYGAYQFTDIAWRKYCLLYFKDTLNIRIPANQDSVAFRRISGLIDQYSPEQIAAIWNCGSPSWENKVGINKDGVKYNVPYHVRKFLKQYNS
jgi:hypothetical protein